MLIEQLEQLASELGGHAEIGIASLLHPCLGDRGVALLCPAIAQVAQRVRASYLEALAIVLVPELNRLASSGGNVVLIGEDDRPSYQCLPSPHLAPTTPDYCFGGAGNTSATSSPISSKRHSLNWPNTAQQQQPTPSSSSQDVNDTSLAPDASKTLDERVDATSSPPLPQQLQQQQQLHAERKSLDQGREPADARDGDGPEGPVAGNLLADFCGSLSSISAPNPALSSPLIRAASEGGVAQLAAAQDLDRPVPWQQQQQQAGEQQQQQQQQQPREVDRRSTGDFRGLTIASPMHQQQLRICSSVPRSAGGGAGADPSQASSSSPSSAMAALQQHMIQQEQQLLMSSGGGGGGSAYSPSSFPHHISGGGGGGGGSGMLSPSHPHHLSPTSGGGGMFGQTSEQDLVAALQQSLRDYSASQAAGGGPPLTQQQQQAMYNQLQHHAMQSQQQGGQSNQFRSLPGTPARLNQPTSQGGGGGSGGNMFSPPVLDAQQAAAVASRNSSLLSAALSQVSIHAQQQQGQGHPGGLMPRRSLPDSFALPFGYPPNQPPPQQQQQQQQQTSPRASGPPGSKHVSHPSCSDWLSMSSPTGSLLDLQGAYSAVGGLSSIPSRQDLEMLLSMQPGGGSAGGSGGGGAGLPSAYGPGSPTHQQQMQAGSPMLGGSGGGGGSGGMLGAAGEMPPRFKVLPLVVTQRIGSLTSTSCVISIRDFDDKVVSKMALLVDSYGVDEAMAMLSHLEHRMRTKQGAMKNGPGYLDVAVSSHLDMLKAQGSCPKSMTIEEYASQALGPAVFHELREAVASNRWLEWQHLDQGIVQLVKKLPKEGAVEKLQEISCHSFKNVDNIKGCIMSILNSKIREDRRKQ